MFLVTYDRPAFLEDIVAWPYGTVVKESYDEFKKYGSMSIPKVDEFTYLSSESFDFKTKKFDDRIINVEDRQRIDGVLNIMANKDVFELVEITHKQDPWKEAYKNGAGSIIENEKIREYFRH